MSLTEAVKTHEKQIHDGPTKKPISSQVGAQPYSFPLNCRTKTLYPALRRHLEEVLRQLAEQKGSPPEEGICGRFMCI